ncbi:MAG: ABC transporter ATP-binding protein [Actinomycetota bacterium]|nr:ABC transporter ATP-binding protein [Actinomycetota bacterium]
MGTSPPAVQMRGIVKRFGTVDANAGVDFSVRRGEVHALLGENGAGKTTLMRILYGLSAPDAGEIAVDGRSVDIRSPKDAIHAGIGMVTQHFALVGPMTVAENVVLGNTSGFRIDLHDAAGRAAGAAERFHMKVDPSARIEDLSVGERQRVEILKALSRNCRVLILDEPTAVLVPQEVDSLFKTIATLRGEGLSVVFISHKLNEVMAISDRITVLRHGAVAGVVDRTETDERRLANMMVGRPTIEHATKREGVTGTALLQVENVSLRSDYGVEVLKKVSLSVHAGEVLGIAGVSGNGQTELADVLAGMRRPSSGSVAVDGNDRTGASPARMVASGVGRVAEDRDASVVAEYSVAYNMVLEHLGEFRKGLTLDEKAVRAYAENLIDDFSIKARPQDKIRTLSGGNKQKVLLARVLARNPKVIVAAQPTRGLDVGATEFVREQLLEQRARGAGVILISEDLDEILQLSDRIVVMYEGEVVGEMTGRAAEPERLGLLMAGVRKHA